jgi:hypothetical protein
MAMFLLSCFAPSRLFHRSTCLSLRKRNAFLAKKIQDGLVLDRNSIRKRHQHIRLSGAGLQSLPSANSIQISIRFFDENSHKFYDFDYGTERLGNTTAWETIARGNFVTQPSSSARFTRRCLTALRLVT